MFLKKKLFFIIYLLVNLYIGFRLLKVFQYFISGLNLYLYWTLFTFVAFSFFIGRHKKKLLPNVLNKIVYMIGAYWLGSLVYSFIASILLGIPRIILLFLPYYRMKLNLCFIQIDFYIVIFIVLLLIYGTYNARHTEVVKYDIDIEKKVANMDKLNVVMVSDIHMGRLIVKKRLFKMVNMINKLNPDILILGGDIIDDDIDIEDAYNILKPFESVKNKYGIYAVYGNHEYIGSNTEKLKNIYKRLNVHLLVDDIELIDNKFYIVGRNDKYSEIFNQVRRKSVGKLLENADFKKPIIVVDHQPLDIDNSWCNGVDLQFSGHTHKGQIYPNNLITKRAFKIDYGYLKKGSFNCIVSSGFGTWGPPIRLGSKSQIVQTIINFK